MRAITDASVKGGKSTHSYILQTWEGKIIKERKFTGFADKPSEAELQTIETLLQYCLDKGFDKIKIYTDCQSIVNAIKNDRNENIDVTYLKFLLKQTNSKLRWVKRDKVARCDYNCRNVFKPRIKKGKLIG